MGAATGTTVALMIAATLLLLRRIEFGRQRVFPGQVPVSEAIKGAIAESVGTFALTFVCAAVVCTDSYSGGAVGLVGVALAQGLILAAVVSALGHVSGAHVNPAITLGALLVGAIGPGRGLLWIAAQVTGAVVAGLTLTSVFAADVWEPVQLGAPMLGPGVQAGTATFIEAVLTFFLVLVALGSAVDERGNRAAAGLALGATFAAAVLVAGPLTGAALNPARAFGPQLAANYWDAWHVFWIGPLLGAVIAAVIYGFIGPWWRTSEQREGVAAPGGEEVR